MKSTTTSILTFLLALALFSCNNTAPNPETTETTEPAADTTAMASEAPANETAMSVNAQFIEFTLGDAEHYTFKDKAGKEWDFGGCDDASVKFGVELPAAEANETNQGWGSNKSLQNKWFDLKYVVRKQAQYIDGPIGDVPVIVEAKMVQ